jgi:hypothetical protein
MKKKIIITALLALVTLAGQGQELKMNEPSLNDYLPLLKVKGYQAYSFDVSAIKGKNVTSPLDKEAFIPLVFYSSKAMNKIAIRKALITE